MLPLLEDLWKWLGTFIVNIVLVLDPRTTPYFGEFCRDGFALFLTVNAF
jgi:hypothetical protein